MSGIAGGTAAQPAAFAPRTARRRVAFGAVLFALLVAGAAAGWWATHRAPPVRYTTVAVSRGPVTRSVTSTGTVNPTLTIIVGSYVSGVIQALYCDYNTPVKQGQVCAKIDPRLYQTAVDQDKANLDVAKAQLQKDRANLAYAQVNYERNRQLALRDYASKDTADNAKSLFDQAQAQVALDTANIELRQAELDAANVNLGYTNIVSPVDGTVVSRNVTMGQTVAATFQTPTLFLIATDLTRMQVDTNVSESDIGVVKEGNKASFTVDAFPGRVFQGTVVQVRQSPQTMQNVVTYDVVVNVDNTDLALKPGMTTSTQIITDQRAHVLRVPDPALRYTPASIPREEGNARLWLLRDGRPVPVAVVPGLDDDSFTELKSGDVQPGDQVIVSEQRGTTDGRALLPARS
jgi:HlyD family secretion protein